VFVDAIRHEGATYESLTRTTGQTKSGVQQVLTASRPPVNLGMLSTAAV